MRRLTDERGAVALVVALVLVPLLGFAALAVDTALVYVARTQLLTASDAAALAVAADCARGTCGHAAGTAAGLAGANAAVLGADGPARVDTELGATSVTVTARSTVGLVFAPVLGIQDSEVRASTTARWAPLASVTAPLPVALSVCERPGPEGVPDDDRPVAVRPVGEESCAGPAGTVPAGLVTLATGSCTVDVVAGGTLAVAEDALPSGCDAAAALPALGTVVPVPVFDRLTGTGAAATVHVLGIAGFHVTGWSTGSTAVGPGTAAACGDQPCLLGFFTGYAAPDASPSDTASGTPDLGARAVLLTR